MKHKAITLIRDFFEATLQEIKALTPLDRQQLSSGIARNMGLSQDDCEFPLVDY